MLTLPMPSRWFIVAALVMSGALWLAISSTAANAVHVFAKGNYSWTGFGSVSAWLLVVCLLWAAMVGFLLTSNGVVSGKTFGLGMCGALVWVMLLSVLTALGDEWLAGLKAASLLVWVAEVMVAAILVMYLQRQEAAPPTLQGPWLGVVALTLLVGAKALLLGVLPGLAVRM